MALSKKICFLLVMSILMLLSAVHVANASQDGVALKTGQILLQNVKGSFIAHDKPDEGAQKVTVGMYGINVYDLDLKSNTYRLSAYLWMRWKGDINPVNSLDFINVVEQSGFTKTLLTETHQILGNGEKYQVLRIEGRFFQPFDLNNYPLDKQELSLYIEDSTDTCDKVCFSADRDASGYDSNMLVPGWNLMGMTANTYIHDYGTNFGALGVENASKYSSVKFAFKLERHVNFFIWKLLAPLCIVLVTNWLALILKPTFPEVQMAMPATALLTIVFLQQTSLGAIPECPSLVLIDKVYLMAYFFVVLTLFQIIWVNTHVDVESSSSIAKMIKIDIISFVAQIVLFLIFFGILIMTL